MTAVQFIVSPSGDELAVLPRAEYDRLVALANEAAEDAADADAYAEAKAEWEAQGKPIIPPEVSASLLRGLSLVTAIRKWRGIKQTDLAKRTGLSQGYLSDLESRRRKGAPETLEAIAKALDVPANWLV